MVITQFKGIYNTVSARDLPAGGLQDAVDVDITNSEGVVSRLGYILSKSLAISTAYTTLSGETYVVSAGNLYRVAQDLSVTDLGPSTATQFTDEARMLFTNDGISVLGDQAVNLKIPRPLGPDVVITGGTRPTGVYNIITTYSNAQGLEGPASPVVTVELTAPAELLITPAELPGFTVNIYMTEAGGEVFYHRNGARLAPVQLNVVPFPDNAERIAFYDSKLFVSERLDSYSVISPSKPYHYHLFDAESYIIIPGQVLAMESTSSALIIGTDREIYAYTDGVLTTLATYGVVPGRPFVRLPDKSVLIHTVRGVCKALPFQELTQQTVSLPMGGQCSTSLVYSNGVQKYVALHDGEGDAFNSF